MPPRMFSVEGVMGLRSWRNGDGTASLRAVVAASSSMADGVASALKPLRTRISPYPAAATARASRMSKTAFQGFMATLLSCVDIEKLGTETTALSTDGRFTDFHFRKTENVPSVPDLSEALAAKRLPLHTSTQDAVDLPKMVQVVCRFRADELLDRLPSAYLVDPIALHPPCARDRLQQSQVALA